MYPDFEQLPHTADIKIRVYGKTMKELFHNALVGMFQVVRPIAPDCSYSVSANKSEEALAKTDASSDRDNERLVCPSLPEEHDLRVQAIDRDALLVDFLSEALYLSDVHNEAYLDVTIHELDNQNIKATVRGVKITGFEVVEIKAVTHHDLRIIEKDGIWQAEIVFDI